MATTSFGRQQWGSELLGAAEGCTGVEACRDAFSPTPRFRIGSGLDGVHVSMRHKVSSRHCFPFRYHKVLLKKI